MRAIAFLQAPCHSDSALSANDVIVGLGKPSYFQLRDPDEISHSTIHAKSGDEREIMWSVIYNSVQSAKTLNICYLSYLIFKP